MNKISKLVVLAMAFNLLILPSAGFAKENEKVNYDEIFKKAGYPTESYAKLDQFQKEMIIRESGNNLKFISTKTEEYEQNPSTGELIKIDPDKIKGITTNAYIPVTTLKLTLDVFQGSSENQRDVYESFEWLKNPSTHGISRDSIGISVDSGWTIQSGKYSAGVQANYWNPDKNRYEGWSDASDFWVPNPSTKTPSETNLYGASWSFKQVTGGNFNAKNLWKGTVKLSMIKTNTNAVGRVVGRYAQSVPNFLGEYSFSIGWGPASISYNPKSGSVNTHDIDLTWSSLPGHNEG
ncbi:hypothetical protein [Paenibacillus chitinolyticus]|uniref:hypothetical protein n=1 Tax=Paenibacillus chitinolyticus TaxID=79263 RepID=UPI003624E8FD